MFPFLTVLVVLPAVAAITLRALPASARGATRPIALGATLAELALAVVMVAGVALIV